MKWFLIAVNFYGLSVTAQFQSQEQCVKARNWLISQKFEMKAECFFGGKK